MTQVLTRKPAIKVKIRRPEIIISKELLEWTERFIQKYRPALEALAKK